MSIFSVENDRTGNSTYTLFEKILYVKKAYATSYDLMYGANVSITNTFDEMMMVKENAGQEKGKGYFHYVLSPEEADDCSAAQMYAIGCKVAEMIGCFEGHYQVLMTVHRDTSHIHAHFIANNIDYMTGLRMNLNRSRLMMLKQRTNELLHQEGISLISVFSYENNRI